MRIVYVHEPIRDDMRRPNENLSSDEYGLAWNGVYSFQEYNNVFVVLLYISMLTLYFYYNNYYIYIIIFIITNYFGIILISIRLNVPREISKSKDQETELSVYSSHISDFMYSYVILYETKTYLYECWRERDSYVRLRRERKVGFYYFFTIIHLKA